MCRYVDRKLYVKSSGTQRFTTKLTCRQAHEYINVVYSTRMIPAWKYMHFHKDTSDHQANPEWESTVSWSVCWGVANVAFTYAVSLTNLTLFLCVSSSVPMPVHSFQIPEKRATHGKLAAAHMVIT